MGRSIDKIANSALLILIGIFISKLFGYAYKILIARIGPEEFGLFSTGIALIGILSAVALLGLDEGILRYIAYYRKKDAPAKMKGTYWSIITITSIFSIILGVLLFIFAGYISVTYFHNENLTIILQVLAFAVPLEVIRSVLLNTIKAFEVIKYEVYVKQLLENVLRVGITGLLIYLGLSVVGASLAYVLALVGGTIAAYYFLEKKVYSFIKSKIKSEYKIKDLMNYSLPLLFSNFFVMIFIWTDTLMLGILRNASEVGIYNVSMTLSKLLYMFPYAVSVLFIPIITGLFVQRAKGEVKEVYQRSTKWILIVNTLFFGFMVIFSKEIIRILFGIEYVSGWMVLIILASGFILMYLMGNASYMLRVIKKTKLFFFNYFIATVINIILNYIFILKYGIIGAALATSISSVFVGSLMMVEVYIYTKMWPFKLDFIKVIFVNAIVLLPLWLFVSKYNIVGIWWLLVCGVVITSLYLFLLLFIKSIDREDLRIVKNVIKNRLN